MTEYSRSVGGASSPLVFYFPWQKRVTASLPRPEELYFLNPGLPLPAGALGSERIFTPEGFPYDPPSAARCLQDLLAEGELLGENLLSGASAERCASFRASPLSAAEGKALNAFARSGVYAPEAKSAREDASVSLEFAREQAQKLLLLSAHLEDSILSAAELASKINENEARLRGLLANPDEDDALDSVRDFPPASSPGVNDLPERVLVRWPEMLRAWLLFLPQEAVFYTADLNALPGLEAVIRPLPATEAERFFPASSALGWTFAEAFSEAFKGARLLCGQKS